MNNRRQQKRCSAVIGDLMQFSTSKTRATAEAWGKKHHPYKPLAKEFRSGGFMYRQIAREANLAIYEQSWTSGLNRSVCYEVIRIRRRDGFAVGDRFVEPAEVYPNSEAWGVDGFTMQHKDSAFAKLRRGFRGSLFLSDKCLTDSA